MAEDFDVEAMLEAPFTGKDINLLNGAYNNQNKSKNDNHKESSKKHRSSKSRSKDRDRKEREKRRRSRSKEKRKSRERDREKRSKRSKSRERKRSRSREKRRRSRSKERKSRRSRSRERHRRRSPPRYERYPRSRTRSRSPKRELPPEERDQRTVFCMQLAARIRPRDLEDFFSSVGKVREVRLIMDNKTRRHKGIAYIEFYEINSVPLALALNGEKLCGHPIIIQPTQAEKNRAAASAASIARGITGPMRLYIGSLHFNITEDMLRGIFEPFGRIDKIELQRDPETGRSKGYGFITFMDAEDAKKALEQLNGFELAGRPMKVNHVTERTDIIIQGPSMLDSDEMDRTGINLGTTGRLQLMAKLAEGTGIELPKAAVTAIHVGNNPNAGTTTGGSAVTTAGDTSGQTIATQCFMLTNMFDPSKESTEDWDVDIKNDVVEECRTMGGVLHVFVDKRSAGNVYVKCPSIVAATTCVNALHGRYFSGHLITAAYVPVVAYHNQFPESANAVTSL